MSKNSIKLAMWAGRGVKPPMKKKKHEDSDSDSDSPVDPKEKFAKHAAAKTAKLAEHVEDSDSAELIEEQPEDSDSEFAAPDDSDSDAPEDSDSEFAPDSGEDSDSAFGAAGEEMPEDSDSAAIEDSDSDGDSDNRIDVDLPGGEFGGEGPMVLPPETEAGKIIPKGGASCGNCAFMELRGGAVFCNNVYFAKWNGGEHRVPVNDPETYVSFWWNHEHG